MHFPHLTISKLFYELLEKINLYFSHPVITEKSESPVSFAVLYLDNHIGDNIPISAHAQKCMMSVSAFRKAFREYTGMSPVEYRMHTKIKKAKQLLSEADMPTVKEVALSLGYDDETYFFRVFYKFTGMTPLEYSGRKNKSNL